MKTASNIYFDFHTALTMMMLAFFFEDLISQCIQCHWHRTEIASLKQNRTNWTIKMAFVYRLLYYLCKYRLLAKQIHVRYVIEALQKKPSVHLFFVFQRFCSNRMWWIYYLKVNVYVEYTVGFWKTPNYWLMYVYFFVFFFSPCILFRCRSFCWFIQFQMFISVCERFSFSINFRISSTVTITYSIVEVYYSLSIHLFMWHKYTSARSHTHTAKQKILVESQMPDSIVNSTQNGFLLELLPLFSNGAM